MYNKNNRGPRTDPWGTSDINGINTTGCNLTINSQSKAADAEYNTTNVDE